MIDNLLLIVGMATYACAAIAYFTWRFNEIEKESIAELERKAKESERKSKINELCNNCYL